MLCSRPEPGGRGRCGPLKAGRRAPRGEAEAPDAVAEDVENALRALRGLQERVVEAALTPVERAVETRNVGCGRAERKPLGRSPAGRSPDREDVGHVVALEDHTCSLRGERRE